MSQTLTHSPRQPISAHNTRTRSRHAATGGGGGAGKAHATQNIPDTSHTVLSENSGQSLAVV